jgi:hypothetical protein
MPETPAIEVTPAAALDRKVSRLGKKEPDEHDRCYEDEDQPAHSTTDPPVEWVKVQLGRSKARLCR